MKNFTTQDEVDGWVNVWSQLRSLGYTGNPIVKSVTVANTSATAAYLHFTSDGATQPSTAADGLLISSAGPGMSFTQYDCDLATTWLNTAGVVNINFSVVGG